METQQPSARRRVLIVDDNADAALTLSMCLNAYGHETAVAYGGVQGIELALSFEPDIIFLDLGMPEMDGYQVAATLRRILHLSRVFIAALKVGLQPSLHFIKPFSTGVTLFRE